MVVWYLYTSIYYIIRISLQKKTQWQHTKKKEYFPIFTIISISQLAYASTNANTNTGHAFLSRSNTNAPSQTSFTDIPLLFLLETIGYSDRAFCLQLHLKRRRKAEITLYFIAHMHMLSLYIFWAALDIRSPPFFLSFLSTHINRKQPNFFGQNKVWSRCKCSRSLISCYTDRLGIFITDRKENKRERERINT